MFSYAMDSFKKNVFGVAKTSFKNYLDFQPEDKLGAKAYIKECNDKIKRFNGTYKGKSYSGLLDYYMFIKDGMVAFENDYSKLGIANGYKLGDPVYYMEQLQIEDIDENTTLLDTVNYTSYNNECELEKNLVLMDNGKILVYDIKWDILKGVIDTSPFAGEYKKISNDTPDALNTTF